ncbi:hypothetical protein [Kangsaoukella pontilimi]|nr:hypothetical protein [Kangsaoukella pontilimi]
MAVAPGTGMSPVSLGNYLGSPTVPRKSRDAISRALAGRGRVV